MAFALGRNATSSRSLLNLLLRRPNQPPSYTPSTTRLFATSIPKKDTSYEAAALAAAQRDLDVTLKYLPFLSAGPRCPLESKISKGVLYIRLDMPGVGKEGVKVWMKGNIVFFEGNGPRESKHEESGRGYAGSIELVPDCSYFKADEMVVEVKDGVLRLMIPHKTPEEKEKEGATRIKVD